MDTKFIGIVGHQNVSSGGSKYTIYYLEVHIDGAPWIVKHRYHDFKELHERLLQEGYRCAPLPPKKFIGSFNPEFLLKRQQELSNWLLQLTSHDVSTPNPNHSEALKNFYLTTKEPFDSSILSTLQGTNLSPTSIFKFDGSPNGSTVKQQTDSENSDGDVGNNGSNEEVSGLYDTPKTSLADFELIKVIGKGSYGKVTLVRKKEGGRLFAMKSLSKPNVKRRNQVEHTKTERSVLAKTKNPFIVKLHYAFQTKQKLYFVLDYCPGGELFFHLSRMEKFPEDMTRFYAAEITLALEHLHDLGVVYRDLKPENILFDEKGHVLLADFGLAKEGITDGTEGTNSMCGTPEYLPPEILDRVGHGTSVDWWALGMVMYEMLTGLPPWYTRNRQKLFDRVRHAPLTFPSYVSDKAQSIIRGFLQRDPGLRLGARNADEVKNHPFFESINWVDLYKKKVSPPFCPCQPGTAEDTRNFESEFTKMQLNSVGDVSSMGSRPSDARISLTFQGFTYNTPSEMNSLEQRPSES